MFIRTTTINKLKKITARKKVVQGSTGAGKTYGIVPILIDYAIKNPRSTITIVAESVPAVKSGALKIFFDVMIDTNRWDEDSYNATERIYTFAEKSTMQFTSFESVGKAKAAGKRDVLFLNEGNHIAYSIADALMIRSKETWIDYNPDKNFWAHTEVLTEPNSELIVLTYKDNEALPPETLEDLLIKKAKGFHNLNVIDDELFVDANIKSAYWANWWKVYGLGQVGTLEGVIFQNWQIIDTIPEEAKLLGYGMDFGFTNDPTTMIAVYKYNGKLILDEVIYQKGLLNSQIATMIKSVGAKNGPIYADSSEPKSIADIQGYGIGIYSVSKGKDSVKAGIQLMQEYEYLVTKGSLHLQEELNKYEWDKKKVNEPIEIWNHCFTGETLITTSKGQKRIDQITDKDYVLTSKGYKRVLKIFNNGVQQVNKYSMQFDTFNVSLCSTKEHKIKTLNTWTKISELKSEMQLFSFNSSTRKNISYIQKKSIFQEQEFLNSAIITARLKHLEIGEEQSKLTYDLMVEDCHEYFANGILVHNCIDATRYLVWMMLGSRGSSNPVSSFTMDY